MDDAGGGDRGVGLVGEVGVIALGLVGHEEVVGDRVAAGGQLVVEFVAAVGEGALVQRIVLAIDHDVRLDAAGHDFLALGRDAERDGVDLRRILRQRGGREVGQHQGFTAAEEREAEDGAEPAEDFSREGNSVGMHWLFRVKTGRIKMC